MRALPRRARKGGNMKHHIRMLAVFALSALAFSPAGAQVAFKGGFSYGNVSNSGVLPGSASARSGFAAGVAIGGKGLVGIGAEGLYAQRGVDNNTTTGARRLDYVDVPVYVRASLPAPIAPFAYAGPQVSFEIRCRTGTVDCPDTGRPMRSYAGVIGAGVRVGMISLEGRYVYGLTDLKLSTVSRSNSYQTRSF